MWRAGELCDFEVIVEGSSFTCHKLVLAASSDYFRALLPGERFADSHDHTLQEMRSATLSLRIIISSCKMPPLLLRKKTMSCPSW